LIVFWGTLGHAEAVAPGDAPTTTP